MKVIWHYPLAVLLIFLAAVCADAITIEEAYRAVPHQQTRFDLATAKMSSTESAFLDKLFHLTDLALVERVQTLMWFRTDGQDGIDVAHYRLRVDKILAELRTLDAPAKLQDVKDKVVDAITDQKAFFEEWEKATDQTSYKTLHHPLIRSSSGKLKNAYNQLMRLYGSSEDPQNRQAFFDYLCALDFI